MPTTVPSHARSMERNSIDRVRPQMARAGLAVNASQLALTAIVKDALLRHYGTLKAAAISMGEMDQGQLTRELDNGKLNLARLELLDEEGKAAMTNALNAVFGGVDPEAHRRRCLRNVRRALDELEEAI